MSIRTSPNALVSSRLAARGFVAAALFFATALSQSGGVSRTLLADDAPAAGCKQTDPAKVVMVVNRDSSDISFIDTDTETLCGRVDIGEWSNPHMAMFRPKGDRFVVTGTQRNFVAVVEFPSLKVLSRIETGNEPEHFDVTADSKFAFVGLMADNAVGVFDLDELKELKRVPGLFGPHGISCWPCGCLAWHGDRATGGTKRTYVSNIGAHEVTVMDMEKLEVSRRIKIGAGEAAAKLKPDQGLGGLEGVANPTLTPDGRFVYAADSDSGTVAVIDTDGDKVVKTIVVGEGAWRAYASPDAKYMVVPCNGDGTVRVLDTASQSVKATFNAGGNMTGANFVNAGKKCYVVSTMPEGGCVWVFDLEHMSEKGKISFGANTTVETACTHPDGKRIYLACSTRNSVFVVDGGDDKVKEIPNVGQFPWGTHVLRGSDNYCH
ncbi:MAG: hypothetical protein HYZ53_10845 [Planctomycetes bacterium]|nr:hypothetical protein [Planctomycetota bacterium]